MRQAYGLKLEARKLMFLHVDEHHQAEVVDVEDVVSVMCLHFKKSGKTLARCHPGVPRLVS